MLSIKSKTKFEIIKKPKLNKKNICFILAILVGLIFSFILGMIVHCKFDETFDDIDLQSKVGEHYDSNRKYTKAFKWYMKAAKRGDPMAQNNLGVLYNEGTGTKMDYKKAIKWYTKAAQQGYVLAAHNLGRLFEIEGSLQDYTKAVKWYKIAVGKGLSLSQNNLGLKYQFGQGIQQDCNKALELYQLAEKEGLSSAQYNIGMLYEEGCGDVQKNYAAAIKWYKKAANNGMLEAKEKLKELYTNN